MATTRKKKTGRIVYKSAKRGKALRVTLYGTNGEMLLQSEVLSHTQDANRNLAAARKLLSDPSIEIEYPKKKK